MCSEGGGGREPGAQALTAGGLTAETVLRNQYLGKQPSGNFRRGAKNNRVSKVEIRELAQGWRRTGGGRRASTGRRACKDQAASTRWSRLDRPLCARDKRVRCGLFFGEFLLGLPGARLGGGKRRGKTKTKTRMTTTEKDVVVSS